MARNHREAREMVEAFANKGVPLFVAYYRRKLERFVKAKEIIDSHLGRIERIAIEYRGSQQHHRSPGAQGWRTEPEHSGGGTFLDLACHTLDLLDFWFGPLVRASGSARRTGAGRGPEDTIGLTFETESGAPGAGEFTYADPPGTPRTDRISIVGANAELALSTFGSEPLELRAADAVTHFDLPPPEHVQQPLIQSIVDALHGRGQCPSDGISAARTSAVIDRALASFYGGRDDAFWDRPETWPAPSGPPGPRRPAASPARTGLR
jgi:1,5-anhydro-D-fructose reductase (1,5-anhydro-D-mannitol-forming)